jgi:uncharacterized cupredoxin-like copper-binding protein
MTLRTPSLVLATAMLALAGCGGSSAPPADTAAEDTGGASAQAGAIDTSLTEWAVEPASAEGTAGSVEFNAVNDGEVPHELEVIKTDTPAGDLPVKDGVAEVDGEEVGEVEDIEPGASKPLAVDLDKGHYILICNLPSHYEQGMHADFEVK